MKKPGTPAIEEDSDSGSGGVSAEGLGARLPRLGLAAEPPVLPLAAVGEPCSCAPAPPPCAPFPDGVLPCALWPLTCGAVAVGAGVVVGVELGGGSAVEPVPGVGVVGVVSGAGVVSVGVLFSAGAVSVPCQGFSTARALA